MIYISDYDYQLPEKRIAKYPLPERDRSKLLIYKKGRISQDVFHSIGDHLPANASLFFNNTRVIHARLRFIRKTGAEIEVFCLHPVEPADHQLAFSSIGETTWLCMVGNLKKWKDDTLELSFIRNGNEVRLLAEKRELTSKGVLVRFSWTALLSFGEIIEQAGQIPIPPYLNRTSEDIDKERYQTVYSKAQGSVAAPTAGLHFTPAVFEELKKKGVELNEITLHVGAGTFQPVKSENVFEHAMHSEFFSLPVQLIRKLADTSRPIVPAGTTTLRTLESLYWLAQRSVSSGEVEQYLGQWDYRNISDDIDRKELFDQFARLLTRKGVQRYSAFTSVMLVPGYRFRIADALITNFHQPRSTLLLLIAAFVGNDWRKIYTYALGNDFRFLSYGDSSLLWKR